jgi:hypothetical protein
MRKKNKKGVRFLQKDEFCKKKIKKGLTKK